MTNKLHCPKCGSESIQTIQKKNSIGFRDILLAFLTAGLWIIVIIIKLVKSGKLKNVCQSCGKQRKPGDYQVSQEATEQKTVSSKTKKILIGIGVFIFLCIIANATRNNDKSTQRTTTSSSQPTSTNTIETQVMVNEPDPKEVEEVEQKLIDLNFDRDYFGDLTFEQKKYYIFLKETEWEEGEASDKEIKDILKQLNALKNSEQTSAIAKKMREILKTDDTKPMNDCIEAVKREKNLSSDVDFYGLKGSLSLLNPEGEMTMRGSYTRKGAQLKIWFTCHFLFDINRVDDQFVYAKDLQFITVVFDK